MLLPLLPALLLAMPRTLEEGSGGDVIGDADAGSGGEVVVSSGGLSGGAIFGIVVGTLVTTLLITFVVLYLFTSLFAGAKPNGEAKPIVYATSSYPHTRLVLAERS